MKCGIVLGLCLALVLRAVGRRFWAHWRYGGDALPSDLVRRSY